MDLFTENITDILKLPEGKTKHFFVSSCIEDQDIVQPIISDLEERFHLSCIYHVRDFQGGKDISANIRDGMLVSMKVLLFLTPRFLQSGWCKYETDAAFMTSLGCGYSCIIPVLLSECEIPTTLVTLTYIDGTIPGIDVAAKIAAAISKPESDEGNFLQNMTAWSKSRENGYCYVIEGVRDDVLSIRPAKYKFVVDSILHSKLKDHFIEIPSELLERAVGIINKHPLMSCFEYLSRCRNCLWSLLVLPWLGMVFGLVVLINVGGMRSPCDSDPQYVVFFGMVLMAIIMVPLFIIFQAVLCCVPYMCHRKKWDVSLQRKLWSRIGKRCMEKNVLILFTSRRNQLPSLQIMRYNIQRCKEYLIGIVRARNIDAGVAPEEFIDRTIEKHLASMTETLADDFDFLPEAPFNRHNVKKGKMCICQQIESKLETVT